MFDEQILQLIDISTSINVEDKAYLRETLPRFTPLEKLKLKNTLASEENTAIISAVQLIKLKFPAQQKTATNNIFSRINQFINPQKPQKLVAMSILTQPNVIGGQMPTPIVSNTIVQFQTVAEFSDLLQINTLNPNHLLAGSSEQEDIMLQKFLAKLDQLFDKQNDINIKRGFFASYIQSPLFISYMNSGLTAMRHPELEPRQVVLNTLHSVNKNYLNNRTFEMASIITNHLRHVCGI
jgi:hypothetical protein